METYKTQLIALLDEALADSELSGDEKKAIAKVRAQVEILL